MKHDLEPFHSTDRRVYNGALCSGMAYEKERTDFIHKELLRLLPSAKVTYFPLEGKFDVSDKSNNYKSIIPELVEGKQQAMLEAIKILKVRKGEDHENN